MIEIARQFIEVLQSEDQGPRLTIDATCTGVVVPAFVKAEWGESLPIDLDPAYPLELEMSDVGINCSLSFGGSHACFFPWESVYVVQERDSGLGIVIESNRPGTVASRGKLGLADAPEDLNDEPASARAAAAKVTTHPVAEERRAGFQVIDGGKD